MALQLSSRPLLLSLLVALLLRFSTCSETQPSNEAQATLTDTHSATELVNPAACKPGLQCHAPVSAPNPTEGVAEQQLGKTSLSADSRPAATAGEAGSSASIVPSSNQQLRQTTSVGSDGGQLHGSQPAWGQPLGTPATAGEQAAGQQQHQQQETRARRSPPVIPSPDEFEREQAVPPSTAAPAGIASSGLLNAIADGLLSSGGHADPSVTATAGVQAMHAVPGVGLGGLGQDEVHSLAEELAAAEEDERRINLAAAADGAAVVAANKEARKPEKSIDGDDDSFMRNMCSAQKWIIIELSQLGRVDEVELVNKEMYSSRVKDFSVRGRQSHPRKDGPVGDFPRFFDSDASWQRIGNFTAANRKGAQTFRMPVRRRVRYLLLQFHTHYGAEEVCALNSISVLGVSAAQELEEALARHLAPEHTQAPPVVIPATTVHTADHAPVTVTAPPPPPTSTGTAPSAGPGEGMAASLAGVAEHVDVGESVPSGAGGQQVVPVPQPQTQQQSTGSITQDTPGVGSREVAADMHTTEQGNSAAPQPAGAPVHLQQQQPEQVPSSSAADPAAHEPVIAPQQPTAGSSSTTAEAGSGAAGTADVLSGNESTTGGREHGDVDVQTQQVAHALAEAIAQFTNAEAGEHAAQQEATTHVSPASDADPHSFASGSVTSDKDHVSDNDHDEDEDDTSVNKTAQEGDHHVTPQHVLAQGLLARTPAFHGQQLWARITSLGRWRNASNTSASGSHNASSCLQQQGHQGLLELSGSQDCRTAGADVCTCSTANPGACHHAQHASNNSSSSAANLDAGMEGDEVQQALDVVSSSSTGSTSNSTSIADVRNGTVSEASGEQVAGPSLPELPPIPPAQQHSGSTNTSSSAGNTTQAPTSPAQSLADASGSLQPAVEPQAPGGDSDVPPSTSTGHSRHPIVPPPEVPELVLPTPASPSLLDALLSSVEGGPAAKPKTGNLFDVFKQEFVLLRLNQTRIWKYINSLVDVLNKNAADLHEEVDRLEGVVAGLKAQLAEIPGQVEARAVQKAGEVSSAQVAALAKVVGELQEELRHSRMRETALLLFGCALLGLVVSGALAADQAQRGRVWASRFIMLVSVVNGVAGVMLNTPSLQKLLFSS